MRKKTSIFLLLAAWLVKCVFKVIEERIVTDLSVADEECRKARNSLRTERLTLMLALAKEKGIEVDIDTSAVLTGISCMSYSPPTKNLVTCSKHFSVINKVID